MTYCRMACAVAGSAFVLACGGGGSVSTLETQEERSGYAVGLDIGRNIAQVSELVDQDALIQGLRDGWAETDSPLLEDADAMNELQAFAMRAQAHQQEARAVQAEANRAEGEAFLATNAERDGITVTASGLQYEVMVQGDGAVPSASDRVRVHYVGTFTDGTQFESSYDSGNPAEFSVGGVIPGWSEALQLMPVGSKYKLFVPGDLAYGPGGSRTMEPNKTLVFEVELLDIL